MTEKRVTIGIWGPNARATLQKAVEEPDALLPENFPFATIRPVRIAGKDVDAFRISYVGEQGFELHMAYEDGLAVWDALRATGSWPSASRPMPIRAAWKRASGSRTPT